MDKKRLKLSKSQLVARARKVKLLAMDVDGVLTGGEIIVLQSGEEIKFFNAKDRLGLAEIPLHIAWITGRASQTVVDSAADLGVADVVMKCHDKRGALEKILSKHGLTFDEAAFIGDDLIDLGVLDKVGFAACPTDATEDVRRHADYISPFEGGKGVVRDVLEFILKAQGRWDAVVTSFRR
jgi:3-deoxy-D-manno-octulosonate 8-phosphate phosphatase (KDO 8-P phosphatase)